MGTINSNCLQKCSVKELISYPMPLYGTIVRKINVTLKGVRYSEKLQLTAALCNEILLQWQIWLMFLWESKFATAKIEYTFEMGM